MDSVVFGTKWVCSIPHNPLQIYIWVKYFDSFCSTAKDFLAMMAGIGLLASLLLVAGKGWMFAFPFLELCRPASEGSDFHHQFHSWTSWLCHRWKRLRLCYPSLRDLFVFASKKHALQTLDLHKVTSSVNVVGYANVWIQTQSVINSFWEVFLWCWHLSLFNLLISESNREQKSFVFFMHYCRNFLLGFDEIQKRSWDIAQYYEDLKIFALFRLRIFLRKRTKIVSKDPEFLMCQWSRVSKSAKEGLEIVKMRFFVVERVCAYRNSWNQWIGSGGHDGSCSQVRLDGTSKEMLLLHRRWGNCWI